ncbi:MAG TPA: DUF805 domain-containing protein [Methylococcaceae bacterium]|nr:DUF805 domain-containing protein [Methylococcaceae bacterium]
MVMIICHECAQTIHESAPFCPHCGAPQGNFHVLTQDETKSMFDWYVCALTKYATFQGRARRKEYWYFLLCSLLISIGLGIIDSLLGLFNDESGMGLFSGIYSIAILIPSISVGVRRLHDTNHSGWWLWIPIIPFIFTLLDTNPQHNQYGAPAKRI